MYNPEKRPKNNYQKLDGRLTIILFYHNMICTPLHGKRSLVDTYLTFLSYELILTQLILMIVKHRDQISSLSLIPISMIQTMVKTGKVDPLLTHLQYNLQIINRMVNVKTLRPPQTDIIMIVPSKHPSQVRTLTLHVNLCNNHHRGRVTTLQRQRPTILLLKLSCQ